MDINIRHIIITLKNLNGNLIQNEKNLGRFILCQSNMNDRKKYCHCGKDGEVSLPLIYNMYVVMGSIYKFPLNSHVPKAYDCPSPHPRGRIWRLALAWARQWVEIVILWLFIYWLRTFTCSSLCWNLLCSDYLLFYVSPLYWTVITEAKFYQRKAFQLFKMLYVLHFCFRFF